MPTTILLEPKTQPRPCLADDERSDDERSDDERSPQYLRLLLALLVSTAFFDGYDGSIMGLLLPQIQHSFHVSESVLGAARLSGLVGALLGFFLARTSDRIGRRSLLVWSVAGYTVFTGLTAVSWGFASFLVFQFGAGTFIGSELAVSITMIVEEFPTRRRSSALGTLLAFNAVGAVVVAVGLAAGLQRSPLGWRAFYVVGLAPLVLLSVLRRRIRETRRFVELRGRREAGQAQAQVAFLAPWAPAHRRTMLTVGTVHVLRAIPLSAATAWWAFYAERERGFSTGRVALFVIVAYGLGIGGYTMAGRCMELFGRRRTALAGFAAGLGFSIVLFQTRDATVSFVALMGAVFFGLGMSPVMSAISTEVFPTEIRGQASAWIHNVFGIAGTICGPALVGVVGDHGGPIGNIGDSVSLLAVLWVPAAWLLWRHVPETRGVDLDDLR